MKRWYALIACFLAVLLAGQQAGAQLPVQQQAANAVTLSQGRASDVPAATTSAAGGTLGAAAGPATSPAGTVITAPATGVAAAAAPVPVAPASSAPPPENKDDVKNPFVRSLFFTAQELAEIQKARKGILSVDAGRIGAATGQVIPQVRTITLTGVLYKSEDDWLIWLNGQKLNPKNLLSEIVDIDVSPDSSVRMKWFDIGLNGIIDITMRPHQKYDIVTGLLLPVPAE